ncbi:MAG: FtsW/RodA/SpoVE family cell cycle protein, partial [Gemmatimonadales bacterium]
MNRGLDKVLLVVVLILAILGVVVLYSAGQTDLRTGAEGKWLRQLAWLGAGTICAAFAYRISFRILEWAAPWAYGFGLGLLALTLVIGKG